MSGHARDNRDMAGRTVAALGWALWNISPSQSACLRFPTPLRKWLF